ncbi:class I tRNA ligase family protein, partial [Chloroflexota bacterium]
MFKPVNSRVNFPQVEENILDLWKDNGIFKKSLKSREGGPLFLLYEGPPTANGNPGIHHILSRIFKDIIPRYKTMKGYYTPRIAGWDTHGLPVELEVEKKLGFSSKTQIEQYGIDRFNAECRDSVFRYLNEWNALTERIGFWVDQEHPYITMENNYIETIWWALKQMWDKGLIYQ